MKQNTSKTRKLKVYIILFILGFICYCIGTFIHTSSYGSHDLSELEKTIGVMDYSVGRNNDGESVYKASATYFVDGEIYEWHAKFFVSSKPSSWMTGKKVEVYYDPLNPSDCVIPEIAHANVFIVDFFHSVGGVLMGVSAISFVIFLIKFVFFVGGLGIFAVVNRKNQKKYMGNQASLNNQGEFNNQFGNSTGFGNQYGNTLENGVGFGNQSGSSFNN